MDGLAVFAGCRHYRRGDGSRVMMRLLVMKLAARVDKIDDSAGHSGGMDMQIRGVNVVAYPPLVDIMAVPSRPCPCQLML